jgi:hypothetical protein
MVRSISRCALILICASVTPAAPGVAGARPSLVAPAAAVAPPVELPDTPAARVAKGFLAMIGDGTEKAVLDFEGKFASASRRGSVEVGERVRRVASMHEEWGALTVERVIASSDIGITLAIQSNKVGPMEWDFQLSKLEPGKLEQVMIQSAGTTAKAESMTHEQVAGLVEAASKKLEEEYVYPEVAAKMGDAVRAKLKAGGYDGVKDEREMATLLQQDLRGVSNDKHLRVVFAPTDPHAGETQMEPGEAEARRENYLFRKVELLAGNIGYLRFDGFMEGDEANKVASSAMNFLANADAVIFDMRFNGGGSPEMIRHISSYLFDKPTHLNDMVDRQGVTVETYWTLEEVPGTRLKPEVPVFVLTSARTFSGAEEFSYNLKNLKRATLIGETTGGGAHPVMGARLNDRFMMGVPFMRANNPITHTNWEGVGVEPDIKTPATEALDRAVAEARRAIDSRRSAAEPNK